MISKKRDFKLALGINGEDGWNSSLCIPVSQGIGWYHNNNYGSGVTKISSCWANTLYNKQAGNQMGSDFFWFYFCSIFV